MSSRLLIRNGTILSLDPIIGTLRQGDLLVEDGAIAAIAPRIDADAEVIDAVGRVVMPGLVDSHRHLWYEPLRGIATDAVLRDLHLDVWPTLAVAYTPEDVYVATRAAIAESLNNGVTTVLDWCHLINTPEHGEEALRAHAELPIRSIFAYGPSMTRKLSEFEMELEETVPRNEIEKLTSAPSGALMTFALALRGPESTSMEFAKQEITIAREFGLPMTMHVGMHDGTPPRRSIARLADAGLLGSDMQFVHCCSTSDAELCQMTDAGATIVICPISEMALAIGIPPSGRAREAGLEPALGSDAVCSSSGDLFDEARVALLAERCLKAQAFLRTNSEISASEDLGSTTLQAIEAITVNGARTCWLGKRVGSLAVGKRADIIVLGEFDLSIPSLRDIQAAVVACAHGANVDTVIVDGEIVKRDGTLVGIDRVAMGAALARSRERLFSEAGTVKT